VDERYAQGWGDLGVLRAALLAAVVAERWGSKHDEDSEVVLAEISRERFGPNNDDERHAAQWSIRRR
jgi:hypothetical protein